MRELGGVVKGVGEGLGLQALLIDLGYAPQLEIYADSEAAIGICRRSGIGRVRHLAVGQLWVQEHLRAGAFKLHKILGNDNPADLFTKHLGCDVIAWPGGTQYPATQRVACVRSAGHCGR